MSKRLLVASFALFVSLLLALPGRAETAAAEPRPVRVAKIVSVKIERLPEGGENTHRLTVVGQVPTMGWSRPQLRLVRERHPNNAVAGFELVAVPPKKGMVVGQKVSELTATIETVIGAIQHTVVVRGRTNAVTCVMAGEISCE
ncbi:MAG: hypothetical protein KIT16_01210 [Rhodospirillaceae bacterium]|nr:hypothetical protein [Rhodospirillaceae bacterium]